MGKIIKTSEEPFESAPTELQRAGLDPEKLEFMNLADRVQLLKDAGLNPAEYDF